MKYSPDKKAEALKFIDETNVTEASKALGISPATLFKWKKEAASQAPSQPRIKTANKKSAIQKNPSKKAAVEAAKELLKDDGVAEK